MDSLVASVFLYCKLVDLEGNVHDGTMKRALITLVIPRDAFTFSFFPFFSLLLSLSLFLLELTRVDGGYGIFSWVGWLVVG